MTFDWWTFGLQIINFIILVWLLKVFLYKPVLAAIARRENENSTAIRKAQEAEEGAQQEIEKFKIKSEEIDKTRKQVIADAKVAESRAYDKMIQEGHEEVAKIRESAKKDIDREYSKAQTAMRQGATDLAVTIARHILQECDAGNLNEMFLKKIVEHLNSLNPPDFNNIQSHLGEGVVKIITAEKLSSEEKKRWSRAFSGIFEKDIKITFSFDQTLIAGANIQFPNSAISFNWSDSIEELKHSLYERADDA